MAGLDDLLTPVDNKIPGSNFTFQDADTVLLDEPVGDVKGVRLEGVLAPETADLWKGKTGEVGGTMTTQQVIELANKMGYDNLVYDENKLDDTGTRFVGDLQDKYGRSFARALASEGILGVSQQHDTQGLRASSDYGAFINTGDNEDDAWAKARQMIDAAVADEQQYENRFRQNQLVAGQSEWFPGADKYFTTASADFEYSDRDTASGKSLNPMSDAWDTALIGVQEAMFGTMNMLGDTTGFDALANIGQAGVNRSQTRIGDRGSILLDYKDVDGFGDAVEFVTNNAIISLPYMGISLAGAALSPFTAGLSMTAPASIYAGQVWNEMDDKNKNAGVAIATGVAQAALDRVGIGLILGTAGKGPKEMLKAGIAKLVADGMTEEMAKKTVMSASRQALAGFAGDAATVAANQLKAKNLFKNVAGRMATGAGGEAVTEGLQEATAYIGAHHDDIMAGHLNWQELNERMIAGAVAGGALGGTFSAAGGLADAGGWADVAFRTAPAEAARRSQSQKYAQEEIERNGRVTSIQEETAGARARAASAPANTIPSMDERVDLHKQKREKMTTSDKIAEAALSAPALWRGATRWIFGPDLQSRSRSARVLADMFGGNLQRIFSGSNYESSKHHKVAIYKNMVPIPDAVFKTFAGGKRLTRKVRDEISARLYNQMQAAIVDGEFRPDLIPDGPEKAAVLDLGRKLNALSDKMWEDQKQYNPDLGYQHNYLMRYKALDKKAIHKNRHEFQRALMDKTGMTEAEAKKLTDEILDNNEVSDIDEAFSITEGGGIVPGSHRERSLNLSEDQNFQQFMQQDLYANIAAATKSAARYTAHREFVGQNNSVINQLLAEMEAEGISPEEVNKVAAQLKDYLDAESGNYKRPTSEAGKAAMRLQKNFMMLTTMAGLPLATVSSIVEAALTMRGLTMEQITRKNGGLAAMGKEFAKTMYDGANFITLDAIDKQAKLGPTSGQSQLQDLGFYEWDVGAATVTGVSETNSWQQGWYELFFKATGLTGWTNYTRSIRASIAGDYITDNLQTTMEYPGTNAAQEAEEKLRVLGINVADMQNLWKASLTGQLSEADVAKLDENLREATFNFINDAVALPGSANRPLIYQDPRIALFTQFQGFIATFTANHIPKLWGEYVKRGSPAMKYNAFAVMATMVMLGFASQHLKDLIKYGGKSPYLDDAEYWQRGIRSSGLLGTSERILDQFFPLYEQKSDGVSDWVFNETTGQSPALGNLKRIGKALGAGLEGDVGKATKNIAKSTPVIGPFNYVTEGLGNLASRWNFKE